MRLSPALPIPVCLFVTSCGGGSQGSRLVPVPNPVTHAVYTCVAPTNDVNTRSIVAGGAVNDTVRRVQAISARADLSLQDKVERVRQVIKNFQTLEETDFRMCVLHAQGLQSDADYSKWVNDFMQSVKSGLESDNRSGPVQPQDPTSNPPPSDATARRAGTYRVLVTKYSIKLDSIGIITSARFLLPDRQDQPAAPWGPVSVSVEDTSLELGHGRIDCNSQGDQRCVFLENVDIRQVSSRNIQARGMYRSRATDAALEATVFRHFSQPVSTDTSEARELHYGRNFVVFVPNDGVATIVGSATWGDIMFNPTDPMRDGHIVGVSASQVAGGRAYTFSVSP